MHRTLLFSFLLICSQLLNAQRPVESAADVLHELHKLKVVGNVLYLAAHPDDENTRLIAWLENEQKVRTAYLSLTRGDGGQNLIGTEKGDALGVLRTQELLEARNEDGGEQFFSRAKDFGYSKTSKETFEKWEKEKILFDAVLVIRKFQPDVIVTRFPPDERGGHGHHTASAMVAEEAFKLAADPEAFPEQLKYHDVWQSKRILWNTSVWWDRQLPEKAAKEDDYIKIDIGEYNPILGLSYSEIASDARSQHKSQGFGSARSRGTKIEYLKHTAGDQAKEDLFEGINLSWSRIEGGEQVQQKIEEIIENYQSDLPSASVKSLVELYQLMDQLPKSNYQTDKLKDLKKIILSASGVYTEALAENYLVAAEDQKFDFTLINRSDLPISLKSISYGGEKMDKDSSLKNNELLQFEMMLSADQFKEIDHPYWLRNYDQLLQAHPRWAGIPENPEIQIDYELEIYGQLIPFTEILDYKWTDRAKGELHRDVSGAPAFTLSSIEESQLFTSNSSKEIRLIAEAHKNKVESTIKIDLPKGWRAEPSEIKVELAEKGAQKNVVFKLHPPEGPSSGKIGFTADGKTLRAIQRIEYDHIRPQLMFPKTEIKLNKFELEESQLKIAYIEGSGDLVDENLKQIGYQISNFTAEEFLTADLSEFQTVLVGIRAYNTEDKIKSVNTLLNDFAAKGGTVVVQYNTSRGLKSDEIGPYPFKLSRDRVTNEFAEANLLMPEHPVFNQPNQLSSKDFENWVQERGLYFAGEWDEKYQAPISWHDPGEEPLSGSLLVADHGEGHFIYTGISFFRQLPAGVPGAYRLLANLIAYGQE